MPWMPCQTLNCQKCDLSIPCREYWEKLGQVGKVENGGLLWSTVFECRRAARLTLPEGPAKHPAKHIARSMGSARSARSAG